MMKHRTTIRRKFHIISIYTYAIAICHMPHVVAPFMHKSITFGILLSRSHDHISNSGRVNWTNSLAVCTLCISGDTSNYRMCSMYYQSLLSVLFILVQSYPVTVNSKINGTLGCVLILTEFTCRFHIKCL